TTIDAKKIKAVIKVLDSEPLLPKPLLECLVWASSYYCHPIDEVISTVLPALLKKDAHAKKSFTTYWLATPNASSKQIPGRAKKQQKLFELIANAQQGTVEVAIRQAGFNKSQLNALQEKGLITPQEKDWLPETQTTDSVPLTLNTEQNQALNLIKQHLNQYKTSLIEGVTGSGKT